MHNYINYIEKENYFPGAKTIISTGFRLPFIFDNVEDYFSANFSFSNCFLAEKQLKSNNLFIDENILRIIAEDKYARNLIKYAYLKREIAPFDISYDYKETNYIPDRVKVTKCYEIEMFRKQFFFRELNPTPLTYLQQLELLNDFLSGAKNPKTDFFVFLNQLNSIKNGIEVKEIEGKQFENLWILNTRADISEDIRIFSEILENGKSFTADEKRKYVINNSIYGV